MISFRHHVISLVAVFLALAVGVVLGGGPLADTGSDSSASGSDASAPVAGGPGAAYAERFATEAGTRLYANGLSTAPVAVVAMPGADKDLLKSMSDQVKAAGGRVTGRFGVRSAMLDPDERSLVDTLGSQLVTQLGSSGVETSATTYERIGQIIGVATSTTEKVATTPDQTTLSAREALSGAGLVTSPSVDVARAPLVLVVLGPESDVSEDDVAIQTALLSGLAATTAGLVVLGDDPSAVDGTLAALRDRTTPGVLATVDGGGSTLGQVSATLALIGVLAGRAGSFGAASADGAVPLG